MKSKETDYTLVDNAEAQQYEFHIDGYVARIEYERSRGKEIYFMHTIVPAQLEGRGIGTELIEQSLADVENKKLKLVPVCSFVVGYLRKNPKWKRILMKGINI